MHLLSVSAHQSYQQSKLILVIDLKTKIFIIPNFVDEMNEEVFSGCLRLYIQV